MTTFPYTDPELALGAAIYLAAETHWKQKDKSDVCYTLHPLEVMNLVAPDRDLMIVAVLHDALEDCDVSARPKLRFNIQTSFPSYILDALDCLTHRPKGEETYDEYIERVATNYLARRVKIADLTHNMDPRRLPMSAITEKDLDRWAKYRRALVRLERED